MPCCNTTCTRALLEKDCASWPADERTRWLEAFDLDGVQTVPWVRQTQYQAAGVYTRYLVCVRTHQLPPALTPAGVRAYIRQCERAGNSPITIAGYMHALLKVAAVIRGGVSDLGWLRTTANRLQTIANRTPKRKNQKPVDAVAFQLLGRELIAEARALGVGAGWTAVLRYRTGLYLRLGINEPERLRALAAIRLGAIDLEAGTIDFPAAVIKIKDPSLRVMPPDLIADLREWIKVWRRQFSDKHDFLWIAKGGRPATPDAITVAMRQITRERLGIAFGPHSFRDAAATLIVQEAPEQAPLASMVLQHKSSRTTRHYTERANRIIASRQGAALIAGAEEPLRKSVRTITRGSVALNPRRRRRRGRWVKPAMAAARQIDTEFGSGSSLNRAL